MPMARVPVDLNADSVAFITPTVRNWYYIFDRHERWEIVATSLRYCQDRKGLEVYAYAFMLNHLHLLIRAPDVAGTIRDFKRHTSRELKANIARTEPRVLALFEDTDGWSLWKPDNKPQIVGTEKFFLQKLRYIHGNPVRKGYVEEAAHWKWSSANPDSPIEVVDTW